MQKLILKHYLQQTASIDGITKIAQQNGGGGMIFVMSCFEISLAVGCF